MITVGDTAGTSAPAQRALRAACIGNAVEWYDFAIYGALGTVFVPVFFPTDDAATILFAAFAIYGTAFLVRPLGAFVFGRRGDLRGRRNVLVTVIALMTGATAAVGLVPGHAAIGLFAPVALMLLRMTQGIAAGGELGVAAVFMVEYAPNERRGAFAAWHTATLAMGVAAGLAVGGSLALLPADDLRGGWWRVAFLLALPLGLVGVYLRSRVPETPRFTRFRQSEALTSTPVREIWDNHRGALRTGFALIAAGSLSFNTYFVYMPNHVASTTALTLSDALLAAVVGLLAGAVGALRLGHLSDRLGRRPVVISSLGAIIVSAVPMTLAAETGSLLAFAVAEVVAGFAVGGALSVSMLAEMFPVHVRSTGLSLTAGLATALIGGTTPLIDQILFKATGVELAPALYAIAVAGLALAALRSWPETAFENLS